MTYSILCIIVAWVIVGFEVQKSFFLLAWIPQGLSSTPGATPSLEDITIKYSIPLRLHLLPLPHHGLTPTASGFPIQAKPRLPPGPLHLPGKLFHVLPEGLSATSPRCCLKHGPCPRGPPWQASLAPLPSPRLFGQHQERFILCFSFWSHAWMEYVCLPGFRSEPSYLNCVCVWWAGGGTVTWNLRQ